MALGICLAKSQVSYLFGVLLLQVVGKLGCVGQGGGQEMLCGLPKPVKGSISYCFIFLLLRMRPVVGIWKSRRSGVFLLGDGMSHTMHN